MGDQEVIKKIYLEIPGNYIFKGLDMHSTTSYPFFQK